MYVANPTQYLAGIEIFKNDSYYHDYFDLKTIPHTTLGFFFFFPPNRGGVRDTVYILGHKNLSQLKHCLVNKTK